MPISDLLTRFPYESFHVGIAFKEPWFMNLSGLGREGASTPGVRYWLIASLKRLSSTCFFTGATSSQFFGKGFFFHRVRRRQNGFRHNRPGCWSFHRGNNGLCCVFAAAWRLLWQQAGLTGVGFRGFEAGEAFL
jgi:hypothetical protein